MGIETKLSEEKNKKLYASEILSKAGLSSNSSSFSNRGAAYYDLKTEVLMDVHQMVLDNYGKLAAANVALMVKDLPEARADDFITALLRMERNNWDWVKEMGQDFPSRISKIVPPCDGQITYKIKCDFLGKLGYGRK